MNGLKVWIAWLLQVNDDPTEAAVVFPNYAFLCVSSSAFCTPCLTAWHQAGWSTALLSHLLTLMLEHFMSLLQTPLLGRSGCPVVLKPSTSSPCSRSLGIRPCSFSWHGQAIEGAPCWEWWTSSCRHVLGPLNLVLCSAIKCAECGTFTSSGSCWVYSYGSRRWFMPRCFRECSEPTGLVDKQLSFPWDLGYSRPSSSVCPWLMLPWWSCRLPLCWWKVSWRWWTGDR